MYIIFFKSEILIHLIRNYVNMKNKKTVTNVTVLIYDQLR